MEKKNTPNTKNVYQKIQSVRTKLVDLKLKKTGRNTYSNFTYYELGDFLPSLNRLMNDEGLTTRFVIQSKRHNSPEKAVLEVINSTNPEDRIVFYTETAEVEIGNKKDGTGGAEPIQNLGGKITYLRRYLLMIAFEIVESDQVDAKKQTNEAVLDDESIDRISKTKTLDELAAVCKEIRAKKGPKYQKSLIRLYTFRKEEIENENI